MGKLTKNEIRERLQTVSVSLSTSAANLFSNVDEDKIRYVVAIFLFGDGTASRTVTISFAGERTDTVFNNVPVGPAEKVPLPLNGGYDIESPIVTVEGGCRLTGVQSAGSGVSVTVIYWDDEIG